MEDNELDQDMAEEPKRKPHGNTRNAARREANRLRQQAFRQRQIEKAEAETEAQERTDQIIQSLRQQGYTMFGELEAIGPNGLPVNASTADEELMLAKEYAAALNLPDIRPGQTIRNFVNEVLRAWCSAGAKRFNRVTGQFASGEFTGLNPDEYEFPNGCDEAPIQGEANV